MKAGDKIIILAPVDGDWGKGKKGHRKKGNSNINSHYSLASS
jgi:hypothetical protein